MINRRSFFARLAAVAALPLVGLAKPKPSMTLYGYPIVFTDKLPKLGCTGDIILFNPFDSELWLKARDARRGTVSREDCEHWEPEAIAIPSPDADTGCTRFT